MHLVDLTLPTPAQNLACDEALLDICEDGGADEILRFWEAPEHFVVVGYSNRVATEVNVAACEARNIPILRRCSGGGTVVQGPGCLNYALLLRITDGAPLHGITSANRFIMERNRAALDGLLSGTRRDSPADAAPMQPSTLNPQPSTLSVCGHTDLAIDGRKCSGNSQRRRRRFLLFHGTFLLDFDLALINELLPLPSRQPDYRRNRAHGDFLANLGLPADSVKRALREAWHADQPLEAVPHASVGSLARDKYVTKDWNLKF